MVELHLESSRSEPFTKGHDIYVPVGGVQLHTCIKQHVKEIRFKLFVFQSREEGKKAFQAETQSSVCKDPGVGKSSTY